VLKIGRDRNAVFWSKENPIFTQELEHNPPHVMIWTCNQGVHKWFKSNYGSVSVSVRFSPTLYSHKLRNSTYWTFLTRFQAVTISPYLQLSQQSSMTFLTTELRNMSKHHRYKLAANTMSLLITLIPSLNLFSKSVFPMFFEAWHNCRSTSSSLRMQRMMLPEQRKMTFGYK
jgi:hypothetical protein